MDGYLAEHVYTTSKHRWIWLPLALKYTADLKWRRPSIASLNTVQALSRDSIESEIICVLEECPLLKVQYLLQARM